MHLPNGLESLKSLGTDAPEMVVEGQRCVLQPLAIDRRPCKGTASSDTHDVITSGCATHFPPPPPPPPRVCYAKSHMLCQIRGMTVSVPQHPGLQEEAGKFITFLHRRADKTGYDCRCGEEVEPCRSVSAVRNP